MRVVPVLVLQANQNLKGFEFSLPVESKYIYFVLKKCSVTTDFYLKTEDYSGFLLVSYLFNLGLGTVFLWCKDIFLHSSTIWNQFLHQIVSTLLLVLVSNFFFPITLQLFYNLKKIKKVLYKHIHFLKVLH